MNKTNLTIQNFLKKASHYDKLPALIKNSPCDHNAKVCLKHGYVKLTNSTKTGNVYVLTQKGINYAKKLLQQNPETKIFDLIKM